jgi:hypothetical protein
LDRVAEIVVMTACATVSNVVGMIDRKAGLSVQNCSNEIVTVRLPDIRPADILPTFSPSLPSLCSH